MKEEEKRGWKRIEVTGWFFSIYFDKETFKKEINFLMKRKVTDNFVLICIRYRKLSGYTSLRITF